jgi:adenylate cyclase
MAARRLSISVLVASIAAAALAVLLPRPLAALDQRIYDVLLRASGGSVPSGRIAVVTIDETSLKTFGAWPWPPEVLAAFVDRLRRLGAPVIAFGVLFPDAEGSAPSPREGTAGHAAFSNSVGRGGVVLGYALTFGAAAPQAAACEPPTLDVSVASREGEPSPADRLFHATGGLCSVPRLARAADASGFLNVGADSDGVVRRLPLVMRVGDRVYPSLALASVERLVGDGPAVLAADGSTRLQMTVAGRPVRLDERGTLALRFREVSRPFDHIPAADVLNGRVAPGVFDDRIVFVGGVASDARGIVATPLDKMASGVDLYATAAENLLQGTFIVPLPHRGAWTATTALVLVLLSAAAIFFGGPRWGVLAAGLLLITFWSACFLTMTEWSVYLSPLVPTLAALATMVAAPFAPREIERYRADVDDRLRRQAHEFVVKSLTSLMEIRDPSTGRHARRTQGYSRLLAQRLAYMPAYQDYLTPVRIEFVSLLSPLHDIGKVGIRDAVLNKRGALTPEEMHEMRQHPVYGYETISKAQRQVGVDSARDEAILQLAKDIVYTHHERWDGTGYPRGLRGEEIPVAGRIMALVDVYDALVEPRPYRRRMPHDEAVALIVAGRGTQFDPDVVEAFLTVASDFQELGTRLRESPSHQRL